MSQNKEIETQLRIIHACEKGATGVYYGHRIIAKLFFRDMITTLDEMHRHETEHFYLEIFLLNIKIQLHYPLCFGVLVAFSMDYLLDYLAEMPFGSVLPVLKILSIKN